MVSHTRQAQGIHSVHTADDDSVRSGDEQDDNVHRIFRQDELVEKIAVHLEECVEGLHNQIANLFVKHEASMKQLLGSRDTTFFRADACAQEAGQNHQPIQTLRTLASEEWDDGASDIVELPALDTKVEPSAGKLAVREHVANTISTGWAAQSQRPNKTLVAIDDIFEASRITRVQIRHSKRMSNRSAVSEATSTAGLDFISTPTIKYSQRERDLQIKLKHQASSFPTGSIPDEEVVCRCRDLCQRLVAKRLFDQLNAMILLSNAIWIGIQVDFLAANLSQDYPAWYVAVDILYTLLFNVEIAIRLTAAGCNKFFCDPHERSWNIADFFIIAATTSELIIAQLNRSGGGGALSVLSGLRTVRVVRMARMARVIRIMRVFASLRMLIGAILNTVKSCIWTGLLLCLIVYMFGIFFSQAVAEYRIKLSELSPAESASYEMTFYFGSLPRSMFTIFKSILGGIDWENAVQPLSDADWTCVAFFVVMIVFVMLAVMNVVTGLFLQSALNQAQSDKEDAIAMQLKDNHEYAKKVRSVFGELDSNGDGQVSLDEFEQHLLDDRMKGFLQSLELDASDAWTLFKLLDIDGGGTIDMSEFVDGCFRMKGNAKSVHMAQVMYENQWMMDALMDLNEMCRKSFKVVLEEINSTRKKERALGKRLRPRSPPGPQDVHPQKMHVPGHPSAAPDLLQEWL